ncbi:hypothetical protein [Paracoccus ravus]|uniref:hypothetical protein n=1 Tax=Paracoccus ravus TaxID=2447760 RepID=UPI00106DDBA3|nr:hypothetical protein [Paracoccus ravus]
MPSKATVHGVLMDASLNPISAGKIIATLNGSDMFDGGVRIVTQKIEATTNADGEWAIDLVVNGEGHDGTSSWMVEGYNQFVSKVFELKSLFIATALPIAIGDLERTSAQNLKASKEAGSSRLLICSRYEEYLDLPQSQRRDTDVVLVKGV